MREGVCYCADERKRVASSLWKQPKKGQEPHTAGERKPATPPMACALVCPCGRGGGGHRLATIRVGEGPAPPMRCCAGWGMASCSPCSPASCSLDFMGGEWILPKVREGRPWNRLGVVVACWVEEDVVVVGRSECGRTTLWGRMPRGRGGCRGGVGECVAGVGEGPCQGGERVTGGALTRGRGCHFGPLVPFSHP